MPILDSLAVAWGAGSLLILAASLTGIRREPASAALAAMLVASWFATKSLAWALTPFDVQLKGWPFAWASYPFIDCLTGLVALYCWVGVPRWWKLAISVVCVAKLTVHFAHWPFIVSALHHRLTPGGRDYITVCNLLWGVELAVAAAPGAISGAGDLLRALSRDPHRRPRALPGTARSALGNPPQAKA